MSALTLEEFAAWEERLRGYDVHPHPIEPALPFEPIPRAQPKPAIDDGRRPGLFERLFRRTEPPPSAPSAPTSRYVPPEARERFLDEFLILAPPGLEVREDLGADFLQALAAARFPISFELSGSPEGVAARFAVESSDRYLLAESLRAFYPEIKTESSLDYLSRAYEETCDEVFATHIDFGLAGGAFEQFGIARTLAADPFIGIVTALENASEEDEFALVQVVFERDTEAWGVECMSALEALEAPGDMLARARKKFARQLYSATISVSAWSPIPARTDRIAKSVGRALIAATRGEHNALIPLANEGYPVPDHLGCAFMRTSHRRGMLLSADELFALVHIPASSVRSTRLLRLAEVRTRRAPSLVLGDGVKIGVNVHDGVSRYIGLPIEQRLRHTYLVGASGTGKSTLLLSMIQQDMEAGRGVALLDPHGDLADEVLARVPAARTGDVVLIDPADEEYAVGLNVLGGSSDLERTLLASDLSAVFRRLSTSWGDQMHTVLSQAVIAILEHPEGGTLLDLRRFLVDAHFRSEFLKRVSEPETLFYWTREFPLLKGRPEAPILTRLDAFLRTRPLRLMVAQKARSVDFRRVLDEGQILICRLSQGAIGEENSSLLGSLIVSKLQQAALSRQNEESTRRKPFFTFIDEYHHFVTPSLASLLSGVRKYGMGLTLAHQNLEQIASRDSDVSAATLANAATRIVFRVSEQDARKLESGFSFFEASDLQSLGVGEAVARVERSVFDFNLRTEPLARVSASDATARREEVRARSRAAHATPRSEVEAVLAAQLAQMEHAHPRVAPRVAGRAARPEATEAPQPPVRGSGKPSREPVEAEAQTPTSSEDLRAHRPGRGGAEHKYLQDFVRRLGTERGFTVSLEREVLSGHGYVDAVLEGGGVTIGVEISVSTPPKHEAANLVKCLAAGCDFAILVSADEKRLGRVRGLLAEPDDERVRLLTPNELAAYLDQVHGSRPRVANDPAAVKSAASQVKYGRLPASEAAAYMGLATQTLAKYRVTGESPPFIKVGRGVFYEVAELDRWLDERRRRSTSDDGSTRPASR